MGLTNNKGGGQQLVTVKSKHQTINVTKTVQLTEVFSITGKGLLDYISIKAQHSSEPVYFVLYVDDVEVAGGLTSLFSEDVNNTFRNIWFSKSIKVTARKQGGTDGYGGFIYVGQYSLS